MNIIMFTKIDEARDFLSRINAPQKLKNDYLALVEESFKIKKWIIDKNGYGENEFQKYFLSKITPENSIASRNHTDALRAALIGLKNGLVQIAKESNYPDHTILAKIAVYSQQIGMSHLEYEENKELENQKMKELPYE